MYDDYYVCDAYDEDGNHYQVRYELTADYKNIDDEYKL